MDPELLRLLAQYQADSTGGAFLPPGFGAPELDPGFGARPGGLQPVEPVPYEAPRGLFMPPAAAAAPPAPPKMQERAVTPGDYFPGRTVEALPLMPDAFGEDRTPAIPFSGPPRVAAPRSMPPSTPGMVDAAGPPKTNPMMVPPPAMNGPRAFDPRYATNESGRPFMTPSIGVAGLDPEAGPFRSAPPSPDAPAPTATAVQGQGDGAWGKTGTGTGMWDRLKAWDPDGTMLMLMGGGLMSGRNWSEGLGQAFAAAGNVSVHNRKTAKEKEAQNATRNYLRARGVPEADIEAAVNNPAVMQTVMARFAPKTEWTDAEVNGIKGQRKSDGEFKPYPGQDQPADLKLYAVARQEAIARGQTPPTFTDWDTARRRASANSVTIDQKTQGAGDKKAEETIVDRFGKVWEDGDAARTDLEHIRQLRGISGKIGADPTAAIRGYLATWGVKLGDDIGQIEAYNALIDKLTPQQRVPGSGATSDYDARMFKNSLPGLIKTEEGRRILIDTMESLAMDRQARADIAARTFTGEISRKDAVAEMRKLPSPLTAFREWQKANEGASGTAGPAPSSAAPQPSAAEKRVATEAEYRALAPGAVFIGPDGRRRQKPQ